MSVEADNHQRSVEVDQDNTGHAMASSVGAGSAMSDLNVRPPEPATVLQGVGVSGNASSSYSAADADSSREAESSEGNDLANLPVEAPTSGQAAVWSTDYKDYDGAAEAKLESFKDPSEHGHNDGKRWVRLKRREQDDSLRHLIELADKSRPGEILPAVVDRTEKQGCSGQRLFAHAGNRGRRK